MSSERGSTAIEARHIQGLILYIAMSAAVALANRYLTHHFDPVSQNFYRFASGAVLLLTLSLWRMRDVRRLLSQPSDALRSVLCGTFIALSMSMTILGLGGISAATAAILAVAYTPVTIGLTMLVYPDERAQHPKRFLLGLAGLLAATGVYSLAATGEAGGGVDQWWGIGFYCGGLLLHAVLTLLLKGVLRRQDSQAVASMNAFVCTAVLAGWAWLAGGLAPPQVAGWPVAGVLMLSGLLGIWVGLALYNWLMIGVGVVRLRLIICAQPPIVALAGWLILGEAVGVGQVICGAVILACVVYLMRMKGEAQSVSLPASPPARAPAHAPSTPTREASSHSNVP